MLLKDIAHDKGVSSKIHYCIVNSLKMKQQESQHDGTDKKGTFNNGKLDDTTIEVILNTILSFITMSNQMELTDHLMLSFFNFNDFLVDSALKELHSVTPHSNIKLCKISSFLLKNSSLPSLQICLYPTEGGDEKCHAETLDN